MTFKLIKNTSELIFPIYRFVESDINDKEMYLKNAIIRESNIYGHELSDTNIDELIGSIQYFINSRVEKENSYLVQLGDLYTCRVHIPHLY